MQKVFKDLNHTNSGTNFISLGSSDLYSYLVFEV
jgi:hypothetical protein